MDYSLPKLFRIYGTYVLAFKKRVSIMAVLMLLILVQKMWTPFIVRDITLLITGGNAEPSAFLNILTLLAGVMVSGVVLRFVRDMLNIKFQLHIMEQLYVDAFTYLHGHSMSFFHGTFVGSLVKKVNRYVYAFESIADRMTFFFYPFALEFTAALAILWYLHWGFGAIMTGYFVLFVIVTAIGIKMKVPYDMSATKAQTAISGRLADTVTNAQTIKSFAALPREVDEFTLVVGHSTEASRKLWALNTYLRGVQEFLMACFSFLLFGTYAYMSYHQMIKPEDVILLFGLDNILKGRMWDLGNQLRMLFSESAHAMEMVEILETPHQVVDKPEAKELVL